jgi:hypothetical protein
MKVGQIVLGARRATHYADVCAMSWARNNA